MAITWAGTAWVATTAYVAGQRVINDSGKVYRCTTAGTSAGSGGPTGTTSAITDGSVVWEYLGADTGSVVDLAPELSTTPAAAQVTILGSVLRQMDAESWGDLYDDGQRALAAHIATVAKSRGKGPLTNEALGSASRGYASMLASSGLLGTTMYGLEYRRLARLTPAALGAVT